MLSLFSIKASAATSTYSNVLDDLNKDKDFNPSDYPAIENDYSLQVIQVAEGENGELFVYVYQPSDYSVDLKATHINMSTKHYEDLEQNYQLYTLKWLSSYGTIDKYVVNDFTVSKDLYRYYNIAAIYRDFNEDLGDVHEAGTDDVTGYKGFKVGKFVAAYYYNGSLKYEAADIDVVDVDIVSTGIVRYSDGFLLKQEYCDSHFVAFKIPDYDVTDIYDATIKYDICNYSYSEGPGLTGEPTTKNERTITVDIYDWEKGNNGSGGILGHSYEWDRIQTISEFKSMLDDSENEKIVYDGDSIDTAEFVFLFLETDYSVVSGATGATTFFSERVTGVSILRLHFATETGTYNLGVVSDIVSDDGNPDYNIGVDDNIQNTLENLESGEWWEKIMMVLGIIILLLLLSIFTGPLSAFFKIIWTGIKFIGRCIITIISAPFEFIVSLFKQNK